MAGSLFLDGYKRPTKDKKKEEKKTEGKKPQSSSASRVNERASKSTALGGGYSVQQVQKISKASTKPRSSNTKQSTTQSQTNTGSNTTYTRRTPTLKERNAQRQTDTSTGSKTTSNRRTPTAKEMLEQRKNEENERRRNRDANLNLKQTQTPASRRRAEPTQNATDRRKIAQAMKSGDYDRASELRGPAKSGSLRAKYEQWDKDISDTITHTIKQGLAADARVANLGMKGITQKDDFLYTTEEQRKQADKKTEERDKRLARIIENETKAIEDAQKQHGYLGKQALSAVSSTTGMGMDIAAGAIIPGSSLFHMWARSTGTSLGEVNKKADNLRKKLKATGQYSDEELDEMFKNVDAYDMANAAASGGIEVLSELLFPGIGAARKVIGGKGMSIAERAGAKLFNRVGEKASAGLLRNIVKGTGEEVLEEEVGGPLQAWASNIIYGNRFQRYNEDAVKRSLADQSNTLRSQIRSDDDARAAAARLNSQSFMDDSIQAYMESGISKKEATELAELSREYLSASLTGDVDAMKKYQDEMVSKLAGEDNSLKAKFGLQDAIDAAVSTSMMTLATGAPGAISTMQIGNSYKDSVGLDAVKQQAEIILNWGEEKDRSRAQAIMDHIDNGGDLSGTQVYEIVQQAAEVAAESKESEQTKNRLVQTEMRKKDLRINPFNPDGTLAPQTSRRYEQIVNDTMGRYAALSQIGEGFDFDASEVELGADIGAAFKTGVISSEQINELARGSAATKTVFEDVTGIDIKQFDSNTEMRDALMAEAAQNMVNSARLEQAAWNDEERGHMADYLSKGVGGTGDIAIQNALAAVDPRDRGKFILTGEASRRVYEYARNTDDSWNDVKHRFGEMFEGADSAALKSVFNAAKEDKAIAETAYYGKVVKSGEELKRSSVANADTAVVAGKYTDNRSNKEGDKSLAEESLLKSFVKAFGINVEVVDDLASPVMDAEGNPVLDMEGNPVYRQDNGLFDPNTNTLVVNAHPDVTRTITQTATHELTHFIAVHAPDEYVKLSRYIMDAWYKQDAEGFKREVGAIQRLYKQQKNQDLSTEQALEELIANGTADFNWGDEDFIAEVTAKEPTLASKIIDAIKEVLRKIRSILASGDVLDAASREALYDKAVEFDTVRSLWVKAAQTARQAEAQQAVDEWQDRANRYSVGYHAGDLGKSTVDDYAHQGYSRGTGHFGFGTYFVGNEEQINYGDYGKRKHETVDFDKYNLAAPRDAERGFLLHDALKRIDGFIQDYSKFSKYLDPLKRTDEAWDEQYYITRRVHDDLDDITWDLYQGDEVNQDKKARVDSYVETLPQDYKDEIEEKTRDFVERNKDGNASEEYWRYEAIADVAKEYGEDWDGEYNKFRFLTMDIRKALGYKVSEAQVEEALKKTEEIVKGYGDGWRLNAEPGLDSGATVFMKQLGYEGVDVRHIKELDNTGYGSVIYDLKDEDLARKQEIGTARFSIAPEAREELNDKGIDITESGSAVRYSLYSWQDTDIDALKDKLRKAGFDDKRIDKWVKDVNSIAALITGDMERLNYTADQFQDALKPNAEYFYTLDLSTLCQKRRLYQGTYNKIMRYLVNSVLLPEDTVRLRAMMDEMGYQVPCGICYEESRKKNEGKFAERWLNGYGKKWKGYKNQEHDDPYIPTLYEVTTTEGREKLREEHPEAYESYVKYQKTRGSANPKISYTHTDYRGDILRMTDGDIEKVKHIGGLRIQSFSDFEIPHVIDMMQAVMDMSAQNLTAQAYTKVPAFARIFGGTGIKINLSLIGRYNPETDQLEFDAKEGIDPEEAFKLRDKYSKNVGTILVGSDDVSILKAWADPRVDMVIPFHRSGWSKKEFEKLGLVGYKDYTKGQTERYMMGKKDMALSTASKALGLAKEDKLQPIYSADYWDENLSGKENAERYLALCAEKHYRPVFYQFLHDNGDGTWSLQEDGSTDGYWKSLIDFKMYDNEGNFAPQEEVQPVFDMDEARQIMDEYEGGADTLPVADDVVEEFLKEYKANHPKAKFNIPDNARLSISVNLDDDYMAAVNSNNMDEAQRLVDEAAGIAGMRVAHRYHGTMNAGFTVFDKAYAKVGGNSGAGFYFSTEEDDSINHYQDVEGADNYYKWSSLAEHINQQIEDGEWEGPELETYEDVEEYAKNQLNANPGTYDVYLNYKNPYIRNGRQSTNIFNTLDGNFDDSAIDRNDYDSEDDYDDAWHDAYYEHIYDGIYNAVYEAYSDLEDFYDILDAPDVSKVTDKLAEHAIDYESLTWDEIENAVWETELIRDGWTEQGYGAPEFARAIIENFGFDAIEDKEVSSKFGQLSREMMTDTEHIIVFKPEQIKLSDPVTYAEDGSVIPLSERFDPTNNDIRYSLPTTDANGNVLTDGQMEYFKNSQARDRDGKLAVVYHSTRNGGFTIFDPSYSDDRRSIFFTDSYDMSQSYSGGGEEFNAMTFGLPEVGTLTTLSDVLQYFDKLSQAQEDMIDIYLYDADAENTYEYRPQSWSNNKSLSDFIDEYGDAPENGVQGEFVDGETGEIIGEFNTINDMFAELKECVNYLNESSGGTNGREEIGTYACYLNLEDPLILECNDANWDSILDPYFKPVRISYDGESYYKDNTTIPWTLDELREDYGDLFVETLQNEDAYDLDGMGKLYYVGEDQAEVLDPEVDGMPLEGNTRFWCEEAEAMGHDGVIFRDLQDYGTYSRGYGAGGDVYVAFSSNQVKDINNENPTENPDIRYSIPTKEDVLDYIASTVEDINDIPLSDAALEQSRQEHIAAAEAFTASITDSWGRRTLNLDNKIEETPLKNKLIGLMKQVRKGSNTDRQYRSETLDSTIKAVKAMHGYAKGNNAEAFARLAWDAAEAIVDDINYNDDLYIKYEGLRNYFAATNMAIPEDMIYDADFADFVRDNYGRMRFFEDGESIEAVYNHLAEEYPDLFTKDMEDPIDMMIQMDYVLTYIEPYKDAYTSEQHAKLVEDIANNLCDIVSEGKEYRATISDLNIQAMKQRHQEAVAKITAERNLQVEKQRERAEKWKQKYSDRIQKDKADRQAKKEKKEHRKHFTRIQKNYNTLCNWVLKPTKEKNVPEEFRKSLADLLMTMDLQTENSKELEAKTGRIASKTFKMRELKDELAALSQRKGEDGSSIFDIDNNTAYLMESLSKKLDGKSVDELDAVAIRDIDIVFSAIIRNIQRYKKVRTEAKMAELSDVGGRGVEFFKAKIDRDGTFKKRGAIQTINATALTPAYLFDRMGPLKEMYDVLRHNGFDTYIRNEKMIIERLSEILGKYNKTNKKGQNMPGSIIEEWRDERSAQTIDLANGKSVTMSVAQMMSLYCLTKRGMQAIGHMTVGGIVVTPIQAGSKIKAAKDYVKNKGKDESTQKVVLAPEDIQTIISKLTVDQINVADQLQELMSVDMAKLGNEAHRELYGYEMFTEDNYFPIKVYGNERPTDVNNIGEVIEKIKSFGFTQPLTPNANKAIEIGDIFSIVADHCNGMNLYNAYLVPITDFMKVLNYTHTFENGDVMTMKEAIEQAYGKDMLKYILNLMKDINGIKGENRGGLEGIMNKALGTAKRTAVFGNIRVALQQPTAIVRAAAEINPKYIKGALHADSIKGFVPTVETKTMEEMWKYCPIAQWKAWGYYDTYMGRDIEDVMMNTWSIGDKFLAGYYGQLDNATWSIIWQAVKAEQAEKYPEMDHNSEEFLQICGRRASEVFDKTQVVDSTFHRSDAMRSKQVAVKVFTAFMAEPTLTLNVFRAGLFNANEAKKAGNKAEARKIMAKAIAVIGVQAIVVSAAQAFADAWRGKDPGLPWDDDDDEEKIGYWWRWIHNFTYNLFDQAHLENNMYLVKDVTPYINYMISKGADYADYKLEEGGHEKASDTLDILRAIMGWDQDYLYSQNNLVFAGLENTVNGIGQAFKKLEKGDEYVDYNTKEPKSWYDINQKVASGIGTFTGFPAGTLMRDFKPIWDKIIPAVFAADTELMDNIANKMGYQKIGSVSTDKSSSSTGGSESSSYSMTEDDLPDNLTDEQKKDILKAGEKRAKKAESEEEQEQLNYDKMLYDAMKAAAGLEGEEYNKKIYSSVAQGLKGYIADGDYTSIGMMRTVIEQAGGDVAYFDQRVMEETKTAYKKTLVYAGDMYSPEGLEARNNQKAMFRYMMNHGMTQEELSSEVLYHSELATDMKVAYRVGDNDLIAEAMVPLVDAGITELDLQRLYENRNRMDLTKYKQNGRFKDKLKSMGTFIWPTEGVITSHFGYRNAPTAGASSNHPAIDIGAPTGTPVVAADGGVVISAGANGGYGNSVGIKHDNGMITWYNHLSGWNVKVGDTVGQGQQIAQVGSTGISTGPHLDFKIVDAKGNPVDPEKYLDKRS